MPRIAMAGAASVRALGMLNSVAQAVNDAYFASNVLLLPGNGTNGAQNNTFLDSGAYGLNPTRNGNPTQGTFTPFSQTGWSNYFSSGNNYTVTGTASAVCTGDFTLEYWACQAAAPSGGWIFLNGVSPYIGIIETNSTTMGVYLNSGSPTNFTVNTTVGVWYHIALVRSGSTVTLYKDGVSQGTTTYSGTYGYSSNMLVSNGWNGYLSNFRLVNGTALYTGNFTPPTSSLTAVSGTAWLLAKSNRFVDNSSIGSSISITGTPSVQAFSPFAPTAAYSAATNGGSYYGDGSGDYLSYAYNANLLLNGVDSTIECWFYPLTANSAWGSGGSPGVQVLFAQGSGAVGGVWSQNFFLSMDSTSLNFYGGGSGGISVGTSVVKPFSWNHIAVVITAGTSAVMYVNGVSVASGAITAIGSNTGYQNNIFGNFLTGGGGGNNSYINGYVSGLRIVKGQKLASGNFTPPTAPVTASSVGWTGANAASSITGTVVYLLSCTNGGVTDATGKNVLETVGSAQISTTQSKWGGASLYCPATNGNYFVGPASPLHAFRTGDFTAECWVYPTAFTNNAAGLLFRGPSGTTAASQWGIELNTSGNASWIWNGNIRFTSSSTLSANTWTHVAVVKRNGVVTMYFNGTSVGSYSATNDDITDATNAQFWVGTASQIPGSRQFIGYIDDYRVSNFARYTANFTPPSAAFQLQ